MKKYIAPQSEVMQFSTDLLQGPNIINIINHSGGEGFDEGDII